MVSASERRAEAQRQLSLGDIDEIRSLIDALLPKLKSDEQAIANANVIRPKIGEETQVRRYLFGLVKIKDEVAIHGEELLAWRLSSMLIQGVMPYSLFSLTEYGKVIKNASLTEFDYSELTSESEDSRDSLYREYLRKELLYGLQELSDKYL